jgi:hypothetical protein
MSRTVSFSFDTEEEKADYENYARQKLMSLSALAKMALGQYRAKYPHRREQDGGAAKEPEDMPVAPKTVQPTRLEDNGSESAVMNSITMTEEEITEKEAMNPDSDF